MLNMIGSLNKKLYRQNKGRNLVAILAIILTTLMFTTLFVLSQSMSQTIMDMAFKQIGSDAHVSSKSISDLQIELLASHPDVKEVGSSMLLGYAVNTELKGGQVEIRYGSDNYAGHSLSYPTTGKMPQSNTEIALDSITLNRLGILQELGQEVTLIYKKDLSGEEYETMTFTLCGFWENNASLFASRIWVSEETVMEARVLEERVSEEHGYAAQIILYSDSDLEGQMEQILTDLGMDDFNYDVNIAYDPSSRAMAASETLPMYLGMVMVFFTGYLIIYNIFQISVTNDIQLYGKLKTLGTTKNQIRKLIMGQANRLCIIGIPVGLLSGYLLGRVLVPVMITKERSSVSASPVIFIGSAVFAWLTVLISCQQPAGIAGKVSPMEASRYSEVQTGILSRKKTGKGTSLSGMAWANLGRNRKRTVTVICSMSLGLVLLSCFYAQYKSFDMEQYLVSLMISDFMVIDATNESYGGYNPASNTISDEFLRNVEQFGGLEEMGRMYSREMELVLSEQAIANMEGFYGRDDRMELMRYDLFWIESYQETIESKRLSAVIYGFDKMLFDIQVCQDYLVDGTIDMEAFYTGDYVFAYCGVSMEEYHEQMPTYSVGESITIGDKAYQVMGILESLNPINRGKTGAACSLGFILPSQEFKRQWPENNIRKLFFNVADSETETMETMIVEYQNNVDSTLSYQSRKTMTKQYEDEIRASAVMGNAISIVIALVGVLNFANSMITAIISRKKEFAMIQSLGMTKQQLRKMLIYEGLDYAGLTLIISYVISTLAVGIVVRAMVADGFTSFRFTLLPLIICTPIILALAVLIPHICLMNVEKQSIVERLRIE